MIGVARRGDHVVLMLAAEVPGLLLAAHADALHTATPPAAPQLVHADPDALAADPLLRLEVELAEASIANKIADALSTQDRAARMILTTMQPSLHAPHVLGALLTVDTAAAFAGWCNRAWAALRTQQLTAHGEAVTVGAAAAELGLDEALAQILDGADPAASMGPGPEGPAVLFAVLAEALLDATLTPGP